MVFQGIPFLGVCTARSGEGDPLCPWLGVVVCARFFPRPSSIWFAHMVRTAGGTAAPHALRLQL
jgi:hypothetical protein